MIVSVKGRLTAEVLSDTRCPKGFPADAFQRTKRKLAMLAAAGELSDLASPPGNQLEALHGDRAGQHAIRINDQWRICFHWRERGAEAVEIVDYH